MPQLIHLVPPLRCVAMSPVMTSSAKRDTVLRIQSDLRIVHIIRRYANYMMHIHGCLYSSPLQTVLAKMLVSLHDHVPEVLPGGAAIKRQSPIVAHVGLLLGSVM